jgi:hypothetical protein
MINCSEGHGVSILRMGKYEMVVWFCWKQFERGIADIGLGKLKS